MGPASTSDEGRMAKAVRVLVLGLGRRVDWDTDNNLIAFPASGHEEGRP